MNHKTKAANITHCVALAAIASQMAPNTHLEDFAVAALSEHLLQLKVLRAQLYPARVDNVLREGDRLGPVRVQVAVDV